MKLASALSLSFPIRSKSRCRSASLFIGSLLLLLLSSIAPLRAQLPEHTREEDSLMYVAVTLIDKGETERAREMLVDLQKRFPSNSTSTYELAYILYAEEKYDECRKLLMTIRDAPDAADTYHQLLGNCLDMLGDPKAAIVAYDRGLELFPKSGPLHLERGIMSAKDEDIPDAMRYWEKGIAGDPGFSSNYFHAARFWMMSNQPGWGALYGEIFLNLEPTGQRAQAIRELLFATYDKAISNTPTESTEPSKEGSTETKLGGVSFFKGITMYVDSTSTIRFPFEMFYEKAMTVAAIPYLTARKKSMTIADLHALRSAFLQHWYSDEATSRHFAIDLFARQRQLEKAGLLEAYNHFIFMSEKNLSEAREYFTNNEATMEKLAEWLGNNMMATDPSIAFARINLVGMAPSDK